VRKMATVRGRPLPAFWNVPYKIVKEQCMFIINYMIPKAKKILAGQHGS
jgi:hypothetical protein